MKLAIQHFWETTKMKRTLLILATFLLFALIHWTGCKKDESNPTQIPTTGTVQGTVTYTGSAGTPNASRLLAIAVYPFSNPNMQGPPNGSTIQATFSPSSPFAYSFSVPPGDYHLGVGFDADGDSSFNSGNTDPYLIYTPNNPTGTGTFGTAAARFYVTAGQSYTANVSFGDAYKK